MHSRFEFLWRFHYLRENISMENFGNEIKKNKNKKYKEVYQNRIAKVRSDGSIIF